MAKANRVHSTPRRTAPKIQRPKPKAKKLKSGYATTADAELFRLHDKFVDAYVSVLFYRKAGGGGAGSLGTATKAEKATQRKWERAVDDATERARAVINAPALTLEGRLMKIHVAGFNFTYIKPDTFSAPYHGMVCVGGIPQHWEPSEERDELVLIASIRNDLHRFSGRRA
jgi:hypothetical protein